MNSFRFLLLTLLVLIGSLTYAKSTQLEARTIKNDIVQINYEFMDKASSQKEPEITKWVTQSFKIYQNIFGGLPVDKTGTAYNEYTMRVKHSHHLGGEADPQIVILNWSDKTLFGYANWKTLLLHELFHLWSAETIRYADPAEHWFNEGFAEYYAYRTAAQIGLISPEQALSIAAHPIGYYVSSKGVGEISMREAGKENRTKFDNYFLVYHGGWVVAMTLDHDIRSKTKGEKSLDDLMKWLYIHFQRHERLYTFKDILFGMKEATGIDYNDFFSDYIEGTTAIPVSDYFDLGKTGWDIEFNHSPYIKHKYLLQTLGVEKAIQVPLVLSD